MSPGRSAPATLRIHPFSGFDKFGQKQTLEIAIQLDFNIATLAWLSPDYFAEVSDEKNENLSF